MADSLASCFLIISEDVPPESPSAALNVPGLCPLDSQSFMSLPKLIWCMCGILNVQNTELSNVSSSRPVLSSVVVLFMSEPVRSALKDCHMKEVM